MNCPDPTGDQWPSIESYRPIAISQKPETRNQKPETRNQKPKAEAKAKAKAKAKSYQPLANLNRMT